MNYTVYKGIFFFLIVIIFLAGCQKDKTGEVIPPEPKVSVKSKAWKIDSLKQVLEKKRFVVQSLEVTSDSSKVSFNVSRVINGAKEYGIAQPGYDQSSYSEHYVGRYLDGRSFIDDGVYRQPGYADGKIMEKDVQIVASNGKNLKKGTLPKLVNSEVKVWQSSAIIGIGESTIAKNQADIIIKTGPFSKYADIKKDVLFNHANVGASFSPGYPQFEFKTDEDPIEKRTGIYVFFRQDYYTVSIDSTKRDWKFTTEGFPESVYVEKDPVVMSAITYGRYGFLTVESGADYSLLEEILKKAMKDFTSLTDSDKAVLTRSSVRCFFFGLQNDWAFNLHLLDGQLGRVQLFAETVKNSTYKFRDYGDAPIFYQLATVKDNQPYSVATKKEVLTFDL